MVAFAHGNLLHVQQRRSRSTSKRTPLKEDGFWAGGVNTEHDTQNTPN